MARHLIRNQTTGATRIVGSSALPFFPGWVELDNYDDELPPFSYPTLGEGDLRYVNVTEIGDPTSPGGSALRAAFELWLGEAGGGGGGDALRYIDAGTNLATARTAGDGPRYWMFDAGVDVGVDNANVVNALPGDLVFVASA